MSSANGSKARAPVAADFKGWYLVVWLTPGRVAWPKRCACCRGLPQTTAQASAGDVVMARYPICRRCLRHAKLDELAMGISLVVGAVVVVVGWIAAFGLSVMVWIGLQLLLMFLAFLLVTCAVHWLISLFLGSKLARCPDEGWPVETHSTAGFGSVLGKDAERTDEKELRRWSKEVSEELGSGAYALQLRNYEYAKELMRDNGGDPSRIQLIFEAY